MTDQIELNGQCLCSAISIHAKTASPNVGACHCSMCRKWGGGPLLATDCGNEVHFEGEQNISVYNSSDWAERGFCKQCGSHIFYRLKQTGQFIMPVGLFDQNEKLVFDHQVFIEEKPHYYAFSNQTKNMTGEELFALFS